MRGRFVETVASGIPSQRVRELLTRVPRWISSDVAGWIVVAGLAAVALTAGLQLSRVRSTDPGEAAFAAGSAGAERIMTAMARPDGSISPAPASPPGPDAARIWNDNLPISGDPVRPSPPLVAHVEDVEAYGRALDCLAAAVYYEAAVETARGQAAVAQVVLNRTRHPAYPRSVCGVVFQGAERSTGCQFSFTCDGAMAGPPTRTGWARARSVAERALNGAVMAEVGMATHYHTDWVTPDWAPRLSKTIKIGTHIFYRWRGAWGLPSAFTGAYRGAEPIVPQMARLSTFPAMSPVEIVAVSSSQPPPVASQSGPAMSLPAPVSPAILSETSAFVSDVILTAGPADPVVAPTASSREVATLADPLIAPSAQPVRQRRRIAAPSSR